jgi:protein gp37
VTRPASNGPTRRGTRSAHASEGCRFCYAETRNANTFFGTGLPYKPGHREENGGVIELFLDERVLAQPLAWKRPRQIFPCSMTDIFADFVPDAWIYRMLAVMALASQHRFLPLTKRSARMRAMIANNVQATGWRGHVRALLDELKPSTLWNGNVVQATYHLTAGLPLPNVWFGCSAEDQDNYNARKRDLEATPAAKKFWSFEPLIGPIVADYLADWAIVGGESGKDARPMHPDWARDLRDQCAAAGVPFFFKQWGEWIEHEHALNELGDDDPRVGDGQRRRKTRTGDLLRLNDATMIRVGKKDAGRLLDGRMHDEFPRLDATRAAA